MDAQQILGEQIPLAGADKPLSLTYRSNRVFDYASSRTLHVNLTGSNLHRDLLRVEVSLAVAGRTYSLEFGPEANLSVDLQWDGA